MRGRVGYRRVTVLVVSRVKVRVAAFSGGIRGLYLHSVLQYVQGFLLDSCFHSLDISSRAQSRDVHLMGADKTKTHDRGK